jgi:hypothetical protein
MAKLVIHPNDLTALFKQHPQVEVELLNKATDAVASLITSQAAKLCIEENVRKQVNHLCANPTHSRVISDEGKKMIHHQVKAHIDENFNNTVGVQARRIIVDEVNSMIPYLTKQIVADVKRDLQNIIKQCLVEILLTK